MMWRSRYALYMDRAVPQALFNNNRSAAEASPQWAVFGTGALTYNIYAGDVTVDDCYKASPYANFWFSLPGVRGELLQVRAVHGPGGAIAGVTHDHDQNRR
jgi:hypothetical protein